MDMPSIPAVNPPHTGTWVGKSGETYLMHNFPLGQHFRANAGVYVFMRPGGAGRWYAVYVGETSDLNARIGEGLASHHKIKEALGLGATHVSVLEMPRHRDADRLAIESDLRQGLKPPLNTQ